MIQSQTKLSIKDNTGVKKGQCIKTFNKTNAKIGDIILISIKSLKNSNIKKLKIKKGDLFKALIIRTKFSSKNTIGNLIKFSENNAILLNNNNQLIGNRIFGPIPSILRKQKNIKLISLASYII